jgi:hypothetical protein
MPLYGTKCGEPWPTHHPQHVEQPSRKALCLSTTRWWGGGKPQRHGHGCGQAAEGVELRRQPIERRKAALAKLLRHAKGGLLLNEHRRRRVSPRLQARPRRHRIKAPRLALSLRPFTALDQEQEPKTPGGEAGSGGGLGMSSRLDEYRQRAAEAKNRAARTNDLSIKSAFEDVARGWLQLAEQMEWIEGRRSSLRDEDTSN